MKLLFRLIFAALVGAALSAAAQEPNVEVQNAWVRAPLQGQLATNAFMTLTAKEDAKLLSLSTPAAGVAQIHQMKLEGGVMKMAAVSDGLALPAGQPVVFAPGGYHVMLMDLKAPLVKGGHIAMTLTFASLKGVRSQLTLDLPVASKAPAPAAPAALGAPSRARSSAP